MINSTKFPTQKELWLWRGISALLLSIGSVLAVDCWELHQSHEDLQKSYDKLYQLTDRLLKVNGSILEENRQYFREVYGYDPADPKNIPPDSENPE